MWLLVTRIDNRLKARSADVKSWLASSVGAPFWQGQYASGSSYISVVSSYDFRGQDQKA